MSRVLGASRYLIIVAVAGAFLAATTLLVYGGIEAVQAVAKTIAEGAVSSKGAKAIALKFIEIVDLFLLGTVFLHHLPGSFRAVY